MDPMTLDTYRQRLLAQQQQLVRRIFALEADLQSARTREIEYGDRAQAEMPEEMLDKLDEQSRREWDEIQAALARMEAGTYGRCETCGHAIPPARLEALPTARRCVPCQEQAER
jgi:RNA polymerase-binding protein DksA